MSIAQCVNAIDKCLPQFPSHFVYKQSTSNIGTQNHTETMFVVTFTLRPIFPERDAHLYKRLQTSMNTRMVFHHESHALITRNIHMHHKLMNTFNNITKQNRGLTKETPYFPF